MNPLSWFQNQWDWQQSCKKPRLHSWRTHTLLLTLGNGREQIETAWDSSQFPVTAPVCSPAQADYPLRPTCSMAQLHTRVKAATAEENAWWWWMELAQTQHSIWTRWGQSFLAVTGAADQKQSRTLELRPPNTWPSPCWALIQPLLLCSSHLALAVATPPTAPPPTKVLAASTS